MSKHTPGPWRITTAKTVLRYELHRSDLSVAWRADEHKANARLIAAAPDLLEALREAFNAFAHDDDGPVLADSTIAKARAAIAKATGEAQ